MTAVAVPEGYVLVPKEPTEVMLVAGAQCRTAPDRFKDGDDTLRPEYRAMIAAAPPSSPPADNAALIAEAVRRAALKWCGDKERETSMDDILYFENNWSALAGLKKYVDAELAALSAQPAKPAASDAEKHDVEMLIDGLRRHGGSRLAYDAADALEALSAKVAELEAWNAECDNARNVLIENVQVLNGQVAELERQRYEQANLWSGALGRRAAVDARAEAAIRERDDARKALESIREYWNRDRNDEAMYDACLHAIETADAALAARPADEGGDHD